MLGSSVQIANKIKLKYNQKKYLTFVENIKDTFFVLLNRISRKVNTFTNTEF